MFKYFNRLSFRARVLRGGVVYILVLQLMQPWQVRANPMGGNVIAGQANIAGGAGTLTVNQASQRAIINWQDFSIQQGELTKFVQPNAASTALNRVVGSNLSGIYGTLQSNGQVYLINPNGIVIGPTGVINTGGFVASTLDVDNNQFLAGGDLTFKGNSTAKVVNMGKIGASNDDVILIAQQVQNSGEIKAPNGKAAMAAGNEILVKASGQERIFVQAGKGRVSNSGLIESATAELKAAGGNEYALAINNTGTVRAIGTVNEGGRILLKANAGKVRNSGILAATPKAFASAGSKDAKAEVRVLGKKVELTDSSKVEALGSGSVELSGYGKLTYGGTVTTEGGTLLIDPAVFTIAASGGDMTAAQLVAVLNGSNVQLEADVTININQVIDASGNASSFSLTLDAPTVNLNESITLKNGATLSGTATTVNVGSSGFVQNGVDAVVAGGVVNLAAVSYFLPGEVKIDKDLTLKGVTALTILDAQNLGRVMNISAGVVTLVDLTLTAGSLTSGEGAGLYVGSGSFVTLNRSTVTGNINHVDPISQALGGGIYNEGNLTLNDSTVSNNVVGNDSSSAVSQGGGIYNKGFFVLSQSTVSGNVTGGANSINSSGAGINNASTGTMTIEQSTISGNTATAAGFGLAVGGGINNEGAVTLIQSTIAGNTVFAGTGFGGGITNYPNGTLVIEQSTLANNTASTLAGGIYSEGAVEIGGSILVGNTAPAAADYFEGGVGSLTSRGYNLSSYDFGNVGDIVFTDALNTLLKTDSNGKALLANNGGPTQTIALVTGSAAYMGGEYNGNTTYDQRGVLRGLNQSIGAWDLDIGLIAVDPLVTNAGDISSAIGTSDLSLRDAIWYGNIGVFGPLADIEFDEAGVFATAQTINLLQGQLEINQSMHIHGSNAGVTIGTTGAPVGDRLIQIRGSQLGTYVDLTDLVLTGGYRTGTPGDLADERNYGGALYITAGAGEFANVFLGGVSVRDNTAQFGGGIALNSRDGGGVILAIQEGSVTRNYAFDNGGGIMVRSTGAGSGSLLGLLGVSVLDNETTGNGGGIAHIADDEGAALSSVTFSTIGANHAGQMGGGVSIFVETGGIAGVGVGNSTIANNYTGINGGAISLIGDSSTDSGVIVQMVNSTVTGNVARASGGGIYYNAGSTGAVMVGGSIVAGNRVDDRMGPTVESDYAQDASSPLGVLQSLGWNLYGQNGGAGGFIAVSDPSAGPDILLTTSIGTVLQTDSSTGQVLLTDNGGPTQTIALVLGSVAIDAGNPNSGAMVDQRGVARGPLGDFTGTTDDIGAYEAQVIRVTADNQTISYGDTVPALTYVVTNGDATGLLNGDPALITAVTQSGIYVGNIGQGTLIGVGTYLVDFSAGTLTINPLTPVPLPPDVEVPEVSSIFANFQASQANDENNTVDDVTGFTGSGDSKISYSGGGAKVPGAIVHVSSGDVE